MKAKILITEMEDDDDDVYTKDDFITAIAGSPIWIANVYQIHHNDNEQRQLFANTTKDGLYSDIATFVRQAQNSRRYDVMTDKEIVDRLFSKDPFIRILHLAEVELHDPDPDAWTISVAIINDGETFLAATSRSVLHTALSEWCLENWEKDTEPPTGSVATVVDSFFWYSGHSCHIDSVTLKGLR